MQESLHSYYLNKLIHGCIKGRFLKATKDSWELKGTPFLVSNAFKYTNDILNKEANSLELDFDCISFKN